MIFMKYCRITLKSELYHHGIEGQKWGVRNGPPYPLDRETHTKVVREGYVRERDRMRATGKVNIKKINGFPQAHASKMDWQWKEVIEASDLPKPINIAEGFADGSLSHLKRLPEGIMTYDKLKNCNVGYGNAGTTSNCAKCSAALEMQFLGYDVQAGRCFKGTNNGYSTYWFDGATEYKEKGIDNFTSRVDKVLGNNGRGCISMRYPNNSGGHSMYVMYDKERNFHILDGQSNKDYCVVGGSRAQNVRATFEKMNRDYGFDMDNSWSRVTRWDTATPNFDHMSEDSVLRIQYKDPNMNQMQSRKTGKYGAPFDDSSQFGYHYVQEKPINYR